MRTSSRNPGDGVLLWAAYLWLIGGAFLAESAVTPSLLPLGVFLLFPALGLTVLWGYVRSAPMSPERAQELEAEKRWEGVHDYADYTPHQPR